MEKKIIAVIAAAACCATMIQPVLAASSFSDITGNQYAWCASQIKAMADEGYVHGYDDGTYRPDNQVTKLEGIALFSRAMGCSEEINEEILELAHSQYDSAMKDSSLTWGEDEVAYMLYKGSLTPADLTTYIKGEAKNKALTRGEAAVIITKAMGGAAEATSGAVNLKYTDTKSIPTNIQPYVQYVTDHGIMNGIDDAFQADGTVTRAQIAVMLSRAVDACDYSFIRAKFADIDTSESELTVKVNGEEKTYTYNDNTGFYIQGAYATTSDYKENLPVLIQLSGDDVFSVDAISTKPEETVSVIYQGYGTVGGVYQINYKETSTSSTVKTYTCVENVPITYQGSPATIKSLKSGDLVELEISGGKVRSINAAEKTVTIKGATVAGYDIKDDGTLFMTINSANSEYDGQTFEVAADAKATKMNKEVEMSSIYVGDKVDLTTRYGVIVSVEATSTYSSATGTIVSITIAEQSSITIRVDGKEKTYQVPVDCEITVNQGEGSLYDFRVGDSVTVTTQSSAVTKIQVSTSVPTMEGAVNGTVTAVNTAYGFVGVLMNGYEVSIPVYKTSNSTTVITTAGKSLEFKDIKVGDTVECRGTTTNGAFIATLILVSQADK